MPSPIVDALSSVIEGRLLSLRRDRARPSKWHITPPAYARTDQASEPHCSPNSLIAAPKSDGFPMGSWVAMKPNALLPRTIYEPGRMNQAVQTLGKYKQNARRFVLITRPLTAYRSCDGRVLLQRSHSIVGCVFSAVERWHAGFRSPLTATARVGLCLRARARARAPQTKCSNICWRKGSSLHTDTDQIRVGHSC